MGEAEIRRRFAQGEYLNRAITGEFGCCLAREMSSGSSKDEPPGTRSLMVAYVNEEGHRVFLVHFYLRPDGTIGGSGKPDPKWLLENGVVYSAQ